MTEELRIELESSIPLHFDKPLARVCQHATNAAQIVKIKWINLTFAICTFNHQISLMRALIWLADFSDWLPFRRLAHACRSRGPPCIARVRIRKHAARMSLCSVYARTNRSRIGQQTYREPKYLDKYVEHSPFTIRGPIRLGQTFLPRGA